MSPSSVRALAVAVTAVIAVLTGVATGLLGGTTSCTAAPAAQPSAVVSTTTAAATPTPNGTGGNLGGKPDATPSAPPVVAPPVQQAQAPTCRQEAFGVEPAATAFVGALFVGAALLLLLLLTSRRRPPVPVSAPPIPVSGPPLRGPAAGQVDADRKALIQACIYVRDRVTSKALSDRLGAALREAGVSILEPTGARFDPAHHEAGGAAPSNDPAKIGSIAGVEVPGYADRGGRVLRAPVVTVYQPGGRADPAGQPHEHTRREPRR